MGQDGTAWDLVGWDKMSQEEMGLGSSGMGAGSRREPPSQAQEWWDGGDFHLTLMEKMSATKPRQKKLPYRVLKKDQSTKSGGLGTGSG